MCTAQQKNIEAPARPVQVAHYNMFVEHLHLKQFASSLGLEY